MKGVNTYYADTHLNRDKFPTTTTDGIKWGLVRPAGLTGFEGFINNVKCAYLVLLGKADILKWKNQ